MRILKIHLLVVYFSFRNHTCLSMMTVKTAKAWLYREKSKQNKTKEAT